MMLHLRSGWFMTGISIATVAWNNGSFFKLAEAVCNEDEHHPENGGYFVEGIAGISSAIDPNSTNNRRYDNATWAPGVDYPDGRVELCTGIFCSEECRTDGCPVLIYSHTCSLLRFCYAPDSGSDVWMLPSEVALANCDFSQATQICNATDGSDEDCCNFAVEEDAELKTYFFASQQGCEQGQKAAVVVEDFDDAGAQCYEMGLTSSRIQTCDCLYDDSASTLVEPCHSQFSKGCLEGSPLDLSCCDSGSCVALAKNISTSQGQAREQERQSLCNDEIPGRCSLGGIDDQVDCCTRTCSQCGIDIHPDASWASCTGGSVEFANATCGYTHSFAPATCDFAACNVGDTWHPEGEAYRRWLGVQEETPEPVPVVPVSSLAPAPPTITTTPVTSAPVPAPSPTSDAPVPLSTPSESNNVEIDTSSARANFTKSFWLLSYSMFSTTMLLWRFVGRLN